LAAVVVFLSSPVAIEKIGNYAQAALGRCCPRRNP